MILRRVRRAAALGFALAICVFRYGLLRVHGPLSRAQRALWLQSASRSVLAGLEIRTGIQGRLPAAGLVVSNHLSYLDIVIFAAAMPCIFIAKAEIRAWPFFGWAARAGGAIFIDRLSVASANSAAIQIAERLACAIPVVLFPESTSTDGTEVLRFHPRLIQPATQAHAPITAAAVRYVSEDGAAERELCWYGDTAFPAHLWKVLGSAAISAHIHFGEPQCYVNPRVAAAETHAEVIAMRAQESAFVFQ